jgi:hypothetical protein
MHKAQWLWSRYLNAGAAANATRTILDRACPAPVLAASAPADALMSGAPFIGHVDHVDGHAGSFREDQQDLEGLFGLCDIAG